jgi:hypothetical protein
MHVDEGPDSPHNYSIIVSLSAGAPYIELRWAILSKPAEPWPEAGWIPFSVNVRDPKFKVGRLGAVVDPTADFVDNTNFDYFFLNSGVAVLDEQGRGIGISSPDAPGVSLDRPGLWRFSGNFEPEKPVVFFNLFNNQWSTNFTEWIEGSWNVRFRIWSIEDYDNEKDLITPSEEFRSPLLAAFAPGRNGDLPIQDHGVSLSRKGVLVTAFGAVAEDGPWLLRCWEQTGNPGDVVVTLPRGLRVSHARPVNLRGQETGEEIAIGDGTFKFKAEAWKPRTFLLE